MALCCSAFRRMQRLKHRLLGERAFGFCQAANMLHYSGFAFLAAGMIQYNEFARPAPCAMLNRALSESVKHSDALIFSPKEPFME